MGSEGKNDDYFFAANVLSRWREFLGGEGFYFRQYKLSGENFA